MLWQKLALPYYEIHLPTVLRSGQAFRWRNIDGIWSCALNNQIILLRESKDRNGDKFIEYSSIDNPKEINSIIKKEEELNDLTNFIDSYLNSKISVVELHKHWSKVDSNIPNFNIKSIIVKNEQLETPPDSNRNTPDILDIALPNAVRILNQDPWETLISFIISSNNNIKRISQLCETLCLKYGKFIGTFNNLPYYSFPKPNEFINLKPNEKLTVNKINKLENELRELGFGYRAKYITNTVKLIIENPENLKKLYEKDWNSDEDCIQFLRQFDGVGPKVADCVALMGCSRYDLVPIDTHVWNILKNQYKKEYLNWIDTLNDEKEEFNNIPKSILKKSLSSKAVDTKIYPFIKQFFKDFWRVKSGWAQAVVFAGVVKLDNGINNIEDVEKLLIKCGKIKEEVEPEKKKRKIR